MDGELKKYLYETFGSSAYEELKTTLFQDLLSACSDMCEAFEQCALETFVNKMFAESKLDHQFWLDSKIHFLGNSDIVDYINDKSKRINLISLEFLNKYKSGNSLEKMKRPKINFENEAMRRGIYGEQLLLKYLNENETNKVYVSPGRIVLCSAPCIGATPDYLVLDRNETPKRLSNMFDYVLRAKGIAEVKTTLTPENFHISERFNSHDLEPLLYDAIKFRHILLYADTPCISACNKKRKSDYPTVNWLTTALTNELIKTYNETCKINVIDFCRNESYRFDFKNLKKKLFVNFVTSSRGKQLLGQCLVFNDKKRMQTSVEVYVFYLYMKRENPIEKEFCLRFKFNIPVSVLQYLELELNKKIYSDYSKCTAASKQEDI